MIFYSIITMIQVLVLRTGRLPVTVTVTPSQSAVDCLTSGGLDAPPRCALTPSPEQLLVAGCIASSA